MSFAQYNSGVPMERVASATDPVHVGILFIIVLWSVILFIAITCIIWKLIEGLLERSNAGSTPSKASPGPNQDLERVQEEAEEEKKKKKKKRIEIKEVDIDGRPFGRMYVARQLKKLLHLHFFGWRHQNLEGERGIMSLETV